MASLICPLTARDGRTLKVLAVCRISTLQQDEKSLADQEALYRNWLQQNWAYPFEITVLASQGSGESLERQDYFRAFDLVENGAYDLVIAEDLARVCRRVHAQIFAELCEDKSTRFIALNDQIDTAQENWRLLAGFATMRHEMYNADTGKRIRRSHRNRFLQGGVVQCLTYGYIKPDGAKSDQDIQKDPAAAPVYEEIFSRLERGASFHEIADWLNNEGVPVGRWCRSSRWTGPMVSRLVHNPILKGVRVRNRKISKRINQTGRRIKVNAPASERLERSCPHLTFIDPKRYDRVIAMADARNSRYRRHRMGEADVRLGVPKKRTKWPGQHLRCGICGRILHWCGRRSHPCLKCSGSHAYKCWNAVEVNGSLVATKLADGILAEIMAIPAFDETFMALVQKQWAERHRVTAKRLEDLGLRRQDVDRQIRRLVAAIATTDGSEALQDKLKELEGEKAHLESEVLILAQNTPHSPPLPSLEQIKGRAKEVFGEGIVYNPEASRLLHVLIPELRAFPYQVCDGGDVVLRAHVTLNLMALTNQEAIAPSIPGIFQRQLVVDLFEQPQRVKYRKAVMDLRARGLAEREAAARLGITQTAAQYAAALTRRMDGLGITDPFLLLSAPPTEGKLTRHLHARYRFEPLEPESEVA